jgi:hypothetical protein
MDTTLAKPTNAAAISAVTNKKSAFGNYKPPAA